MKSLVLTNKNNLIFISIWCFKEHEEHEKILNTFADNLSDVPSESEDVDLCKDHIESERSEEDDSNSDESSDSDVVIPSKRWKTVISSENLNNSLHD
ncbi:hypothetical protein K0M31_011271 [Melipona bicolor]|uniref:Uncharacterized protein n=1 Tax=Melipona bicolor TaxID=60889 RepID=A0AA40G9C7_9HYME|nr:hypothetical protein K0M31_011271 [Melipona bicolor]